MTDCEQKNCVMAQRAMDRIEAHKEQYDKDQQELNSKLAGIFRRLNDMSNRWLIIAGGVIAVLLGMNGYLLKDKISGPDYVQQEQMREIVRTLESISKEQKRN